ncbi:BON domain-containing protein [Caballeronia sp. LjRoot34]|uniref:BON domain-containing protein n=1 Tax=Caballeronia sp. LjRoot34 TaxID=3342325 RepID=UPI003ECF656C
MELSKLIVATVLAACNISSPAFAQSASDATPTTPSTNGLTKKQLRKMNWQTEKTVRQALTSTKGLDSSSIVIVARGNKITLDGTVREGTQVSLAAAAAKGAENGKTVVNNITVSEPGN